MRHRRSTNRGFTLIELLVVIAIIAIISVVVILVLNPAELLRQGRDSNRISDMQTLTTAIGVYAAGGGTSFGNTNTVYVSIPDPTATSTAGDQCQGLGLPSLPSAYSYHCAASSTVKNVDSTGWIPINFATVAIGSSLSQLPLDPTNQSSSRLYYTYTTNGTQYEVTSPMESQKYKLGGSNDVIGPDGSTLSTVYAKGSNLSLEPLDYGDSSLVGLWSFNEGTGTVAYDYSGNNATGTWNGTQAGTSGYYSAGKIGPWAGTFDGSSTYTAIPITNSFISNGASFSIGIWIKTSLNPVTNPSAPIMISSGQGTGSFTPGLEINTTGHILAYVYPFSSINGSVVNDGNWHFITEIYSGTTANLYVDGVSQGSSNGISYNWGSTPVYLDLSFSNGVNFSYYNGLVDDVRLYRRALSASEIAAMYAGGK